MTRGMVVGLHALVLVGCSSATREGTSDVSLPLEVKTIEGPIRGATHESTEGVRVFRGIPYAAPPTGPNRWRRPQPVSPWTEVRDASVFGHRCPQPTLSRTAANDDNDEDCLTLNVYAPAKKPNGGGAAPVMVWIHGGAFTLGSSREDLYDAAKLVAATGNVVVTINYRLGVLGFLASDAFAGEDPSGAKGNWGLLDQRAALEWVARNAGAFGGDPGNVTIFGESAGGNSVSAIATSPALSAGGLFHRAIVQSGAIGGIQLVELGDADKEADDLAKAVGCPARDLACLRSKPANELVIALGHTEATQPKGGLLQGSVPVKPWVPIADGAIVSRDPAASFTTGSAARVPYLIGTTREEGGLFHNGVFGDKKLASADELAPLLVSLYGDDAGAKIAARYSPSAFSGDPNAALARITTLDYFVCPAREMARRARDAGNPVFLYRMSRTPNGGLTSGLGPVHATDLVFLFDSDTGAAGRAGDDARDLVAAMQGYWGSFAKTAVPAHDGAPAWPAFGADEKHLVLDVPISAGDALEKEDCDFWDGIPQSKVPPLYDPPE